MNTTETQPTAGLCHECEFSRRIVSGKGSAFLLCERAKHDPGFRKYPRLPVTQCRGFEQRT